MTFLCVVKFKICMILNIYSNVNKNLNKLIMSEDSPLQQAESQPSSEQLVKISDYGEGRQSNHNQSDADEDAFQQLENILGQQANKSSRNEDMLTQKVLQLNSKCTKLSKTNSFLTKRVQQLEIQLREEAQYQIDLQDIQQFLTSIQPQIQNYKQELSNYRDKQILFAQKRNQQFLQWNQTIETQKQEINSLKLEKQQLIEGNNILQKNNRNLLNEIQSLQRELAEQKSYKKQSNNSQRSYSRNNSSVFEQQIQAQLESLIQKLMGELQFERNNNKKSITQIRRMQQQILELERQLVSKNNKIYSLQMDYLKSNKGSPRNSKIRLNDFDNRSQRFNINNSNDLKSQNWKSKSDRNNSALRSFTIEQMLSGGVQVSEKERYVVASKIINFYLKKIQAQDYTPYNSDKLMVSNYNKAKPSLMLIRKLPCSPYSGELSLKIVGWNLGVILSSLLIEPRQDSEARGESDEFLLQTIERLLREELTQVDQIDSLKSVIEDIIKSY